MRPFFFAPRKRRYLLGQAERDEESELVRKGLPLEELRRRHPDVGVGVELPRGRPVGDPLPAPSRPVKISPLVYRQWIHCPIAAEKRATVMKFPNGRFLSKKQFRAR